MISFFRFTVLAFSLVLFPLCASFAADAPSYLGEMRAALNAIRTPATFPARISISVTGPDRGMIMVEGGAMIPFDNTGPLDWRLAVDILGMYLNDGYAVTRLLGVPFLQPIYIMPVSSEQAGSAGAGLNIRTDPVTGAERRTQMIALNMAKLDPSIDDVRAAFRHEFAHTYSECGNRSICDETIAQLIDRVTGYERPLNSAAALFLDVRTAGGTIDPVRFNQEVIRFVTRNGNTTHDYVFGDILGSILAARFARPGDGGLRPVLDRITLARQATDANRAIIELGFRNPGDFATQMANGYRAMMRGVMADDRRAAQFMVAMADIVAYRATHPSPVITPPPLSSSHGYSMSSFPFQLPSVSPGSNLALPAPYIQPSLITSPGALFTPITVNPAIPGVMIPAR